MYPETIHLCFLWALRARNTAAPGDFTQTGLEMSQNWASGNPFLFTSHAPESISVHFFISIHFSRSRVPAQTRVVGGGGVALPTQWEIKYKLHLPPPPSPMSLPKDVIDKLSRNQGRRGL